MNIFKHELKALSHMLIGFTLSILALGAMFYSMYPMFTEEMDDFKELTQNVPEAALIALGLDFDKMGTFLGMFSFLFIYLGITAGIMAFLIGAKMLSKETRAKTSDFLLTKPRTRMSILLSKLLAGVVAILIVNVASFVENIIFARAYTSDSEFDLPKLLLMSSSMLWIQLWLLVLGVTVGVFFSKLKNPMPIATCTVLGLYALGTVGTVIGDEKLSYFSPFKYFDTTYLLNHDFYEPYLFLTAILGFIVLGVSSFVWYHYKDIHAV